MTDSIDGHDNDAQWDRVQALFHAALALQPEARAAFLAHECRDDQAMR